MDVKGYVQGYIKMYYLGDRGQGLKEYPFLIFQRVLECIEHYPISLSCGQTVVPVTITAPRYVFFSMCYDDIITHVTSVARAFASARS